VRVIVTSQCEHPRELLVHKIPHILLETFARQCHATKIRIHVKKRRQPALAKNRSLRREATTRESHNRKSKRFEEKCTAACMLQMSTVSCFLLEQALRDKMQIPKRVSISNARNRIERRFKDRLVGNTCWVENDTSLSLPKDIVSQSELTSKKCHPPRSLEQNQLR